jgi:hypothetical protein
MGQAKIAVMEVTGMSKKPKRLTNARAKNRHLRRSHVVLSFAVTHWAVVCVRCAQLTGGAD